MSKYLTVAVFVLLAVGCVSGPREIELSHSFQQKILVIPTAEIKGLEQRVFKDVSDIEDNLEAYEAKTLDIDQLISERTPSVRIFLQQESAVFVGQISLGKSRVWRSSVW